MTDVIFSFDTEDFTSNITADAIYREAEILREEGIKGGFCIVGILAEQLQNWGRTDIIEALKHHDILTQSYSHSVHPTINELTDIEDFDEAYNNIIGQESKGLDMINKLTGGMEIYGALPPGNNISYVGLYAFADLGLPICAGSACDTVDSTGVFFCNAYHTRYDFEMDIFHEESSEEFMLNAIEEFSKKDRAVICTHPDRAIAKEFWDQVNYFGRNMYEFGKWAESPRYTDEEIEKFYDDVRKFVRLIKNDKRFNITSYSELASELKSLKERIIRKEDIPNIKSQLENDFRPIDKPSYCISDIFLACVDILRGAECHVCGKVYGFLEVPYSVDKEITVTKEDMIASAKEMDISRFLPEKIQVGDSFIGPADWLMAALSVICGEDTVVVLPKEQLPDPDILGDVKTMDLRLDGTYIWPPQSPDFKDEYLSHRLRLQTWTIRFK